MAMHPEPVPTSSTRFTAAGSDPRPEARLDQFGNRGARNQHPLVDMQRHARKPAALREVDGGNALVDATLQQGFETAARGSGQARAQVTLEQLLTPQRMRQQGGRIIHRRCRCHDHSEALARPSLRAARFSASPTLGRRRLFAAAMG